MKRLLIVEDNYLTGEALALDLRGRGYLVTHVRDGASALADMILNDYDAAVIDHFMPGIDGLATLRRIRDFSDPKAAQTPVLIVTAANDDEVTAIAAELPALRPVAILRKAFTTEQLIERLEALWCPPART